MLTATRGEAFNVGPVEQIPLGEGRMFWVGGEEVAVFRARQGDLYATQAYCPHRGGALADGLVGGGRVVCPLHSLAFSLATGESVRNACPSLRTYRVTESSAGELFVRVPLSAE